MKHVLRKGAAAAVAAILATSAVAQDGIYYGAGLGYSAMTSDEDTNGFSSSADAGVLGLTLGYRVGSAALFYGGEIDADISFDTEFEETQDDLTCEVDASGPYWCSHDATIRLRGIVGQSLSGGYDVFGSLGLAIITGESAISPNEQDSITSTGYTVGLGVQRDFGSGIGRIELIYDNAENSNEPGGYEPTFEATTLKASFLF